MKTVNFTYGFIPIEKKFLKGKNLTKDEIETIFAHLHNFELLWKGACNQSSNYRYEAESLQQDLWRKNFGRPSWTREFD